MTTYVPESHLFIKSFQEIGIWLKQALSQNVFHLIEATRIGFERVVEDLQLLEIELD